MAERYIEAVNKADETAVLALFAADAMLKHPVGVDQGHEEIADFHNEVIFPDKLEVTIVRSIVQDNVEVLQLLSTSPVREDPAVVDTVDIFTLNDEGLIQVLDIYYR